MRSQQKQLMIDGEKYFWKLLYLFFDCSIIISNKIFIDWWRLHLMGIVQPFVMLWGM